MTFAIQAEGIAGVLPRAKQVLEMARGLNIPVIHTQEVHRNEKVDFDRELDDAEPLYCLENSPGADFHDDFRPLEGEFIVQRRRYSCFFATDLDLLLRELKVDTLILMGGLTHVGVHYTAVDAHQRDYHFHVISDCCMGTNWEAHTAALRAMIYIQRNSQITHYQFLLAGLLSNPFLVV